MSLGLALGISPMLLSGSVSSIPIPPFPTDWLVAQYHFDGNSNDSIGSNDGINTSITYTLESGVINQGIDGDNVKILNNSVFDFTTDMTISFWMRAKATQTGKYFVSKPKPSFNDGWNVSVLTANTVRFTGDGLTPSFLEVPATIYDNQFHMVTVTLGGGVLSIYIDGIQAGTTAVTGAISINALDVYIKTFQGGLGGVGFVGQMDEVNFWNRGLSSIEVSNLFANYPTLSYAYFYGMSITEGVGASDFAHAWTSLTCAALGVKQSNYGVQGTTLMNAIPIDIANSPNMWENRSNLVTYNSKIKYLVFDYGINDWGFNFPAYTAALAETQAKDILDVAINIKGFPVNRIKWICGDIYNPVTAPAFYVTNYGVPVPPDAIRDSDIRTAISNACAFYGVQFIDVRTYQVANGNLTLLADSVHPNDAGHQVKSDYFISQI